ncbi:MAG: hypothetical protein AMJ78_08660 [Omnitrophica WOR_2 bacterium SM23_29]|nr:MAG: hypothetical protein AMJ78_08660 [Omnitrophica WOR_2 bacterium SM23_29]
MDGILIVDKPSGMTSHDVVDLIRKNFGMRKTGHAGTLDPTVTGVLIILIGRATKLSARFANDDKEYEATLTLGKKTDSGDAEGRVISEGDYNKTTEARIRDIFDSFKGEIEQVPPMVSALKFRGKRLYELARRGQEAPRKPRVVYIKELKIKNIDIPYIDFSVVCSKGTYIRKLCDDIGDRLGCGGHLSYLRRLRSGEFTLEKSVTIEVLKSFSKDELERHLLKI